MAIKRLTRGHWKVGEFNVCAARERGWTIVELDRRVSTVAEAAHFLAEVAS
jgi:hypothetical protein